MAKKNKSIRVKLIANPGAGDVLTAASRLEQVTRILMDEGFKIDVALAHLKLTRPRLPGKLLKMAMIW